MPFSGWPQRPGVPSKVPCGVAVFQGLQAESFAATQARGELQAGLEEAASSRSELRVKLAAATVSHEALRADLNEGLQAAAQARAQLSGAYESKLIDLEGRLLRLESVLDRLFGKTPPAPTAAET